MLSDLIAKLEAASEGSRELDEDLHNAIRPTMEEWTKMAGVDDDAYFYWVFRPRYTTSVDAAISLAGKMLPGRGHGYLPGFFPPHPFAGIIGADLGTVDLKTATICGGPTPALALCLAVLKAMESRKALDGGGT